jgi:branched-chain amino acid transport system permease protein
MGDGRKENAMQTGFVQAGDVRLQYFEHGTGPELLVLAHGYRSSAHIWRLVQEALDPTRFRSVAISNRGAGDSDRTPSEEAYTVESFARDAFAAVQALGLQDFTLVGHSMGGATVTQFALDHPEILKALVLLNPAPLAGRPLAANWEQQIRDEFASGRRQEETGTNTPGVPEDFQQALQADIARNPIERAIGGRRSMANLRLRQRLQELSMPVCVIGGDQDTTVGVHNILAEYLALPEPHRFLHMFHGVGHSPNVEVAVRCASLFDRFASKTAPQCLALEKTIR